MPTFRRTLALLSAAALVAAGGAAAQRHTTGAAVPAPVVAPTFVFTGHGYGHGIGMSQYGAYGYAEHGASYAAILAHYYPGTVLGPAPVARVRVLLAEGKAKLTVSSAAAYTVRDAAGTSYPIPAGDLALGPALKVPGPNGKPVPLDGPLLVVPGKQPLELGHRYRGQIQVSVAKGKLTAIDVVPLEAYLQGVVPSEMPYTWAPEALKAQAVVARSYALAVRKSGPFDLYDDTRSQVYLGLDAERPASNAAVQATAGQVLLYGGKVATTFFFSSSGGRTAAVQDVWPGARAVPYLVSVLDPYDTISPYHDWGPYVFGPGQLAKALHVKGSILDVQSVTNGSGRASALVVTGSRGSTTVLGTDVRSALGLRSTWFDVGELGLAQPAAPVVYGGAAVLAGLARGVAGPTLQERIAPGPWKTAGPVVPAKDGTLKLVVKPAATAQYRLVAGAAPAAPVQVQVAPRVRFLASADPGSLKGLARPLLPGATAQVQRLGVDGVTWATVARAPLAADGSFLARLRLRTGTYRALVAPGHGYAAGTTPPLRVATG